MTSEAVCRTTHPQILTGNCPWCGTEIGATSQADNTGERRWDISRLKADLIHENDEARIVTVENARRHLPDPVEAVDLLRSALSDPVNRVRDVATHGLVSLGSRLAPEAIDRFEVAALKRRHQEDLAIRILLLGHCDGKHFRSEAAREERQAHALWIIEHAPRSIVAGTPHATLRSRFRTLSDRSS